MSLISFKYKSKIIYLTSALLLISLLGLVFIISQHQDKIIETKVYVKKVSPIAVVKQVAIGETTKPLVNVSRGSTDNYPSIPQGYKVTKILYNFKMTYYTLSPKEVGHSKGFGKSGRKVIPFQSIAVDPIIIPLGAYLYVDGIGITRADDTGRLIKGNHIDLFTNWTHNRALQEGWKNVNIYILEKVS